MDGLFVACAFTRRRSGRSKLHRGGVRYDWQGRSSVKNRLTKQILRLIGGAGRDYWDCFAAVDFVEVGPEDQDLVMDHVARLGRLRSLAFIDESSFGGRYPLGSDEDRDSGPDFTAACLEKLRGLTGLERLSFDTSPPLTDADLVNLCSLTALNALRLPGSRSSRVSDAGLVNLEKMSAMTFLELAKSCQVDVSRVGPPAE